MLCDSEKLVKVLISCIYYSINISILLLYSLFSFPFIFFGIRRYIEMVNQKVAKNKKTRKKSIKKEKKITKTKGKHKKKCQQIHNQKGISGLKKLIRHA
jgi:hypothetical protein